MRTELTIEQSKELIELGISPDNASMVLWCTTHDFQNNSIEEQKWNLVSKPFRPAVMGFENFTCADIFSIGDLLKIMKRDVLIKINDLEDWCTLKFELGADYGSAVYDTWTEMTNGIGTCWIGTETFDEPEPIDSLFKLLKHCINKGLINPKELFLKKV